MSWSEPIHPTRTPNVSAEKLALLKGCPLWHTKKHRRSRVFHCQTDDSCCDYTLFLFKLKHWNQLKQQASSCKPSFGSHCRADGRCLERQTPASACKQDGARGLSQALSGRGHCLFTDSFLALRPLCVSAIGAVLPGQAPGMDQTALSTALGLCPILA